MGTSLVNGHFKTVTILALACTGLAPVQAAPVQRGGVYAVTGKVAAACSLGSNTAPVILSTTVDKNGKLDPSLAGKTFRLADVMCDAPSRIALKATALRIVTPRSSVPNGLSQTANFTATATGWSPVTASVTTAQKDPLGSAAVFTGTGQAQNVAKSAPIVISVNNFTAVTGANGAGWKLIDGDYTATITVSLTPSL